MQNIPILLVSDCPSQTSGLARITRDLATVLAGMSEFRVATLGWMGTGSCRLPFQTYHMGASEWGEQSLPAVWDEWSRGEAGIVLAIWDKSRLLWLAQPQYTQDEWLRNWLLDARRRKFKAWLYTPIDSTGPMNRLTAISRDVLLGFDRLLVPSPWADDVVRRTIGAEAADARGLSWMPHGLNMKTFTTDSRAASDVKRIGVVATNQHRKDFGMVAAVCARLAELMKGNVRFWWHVDQDIRYWSIPALIADYQLGEYVEVSHPPADDKWLAEQYRRCDVTLHPGLGEGFCYPVFESLACGTPAVHGNYGGCASLMRTCGLDHLLVEPVEWRLEGQYDCLRPLFRPEDFVNVIMQTLESYGDMKITPADVAKSVEHLSWKKLGHVWKRWLREGLGEHQS